MVSLAMLRSSTAWSNLPTSPSCSIMPSAYSLSGMPLWPLRLLLGVEVVEVAEELVEAVDGRQIFVAVAEVVLAELAGGIAERLERFGDGNVSRLKAHGCARNSDLGHPGAVNRLTCDEGRAARRATVLGVVVREHHAFAGDAVDVRRLVAHQAECVGADVGLADVVAPNNEDIGFASRWG